MPSIGFDNSEFDFPALEDGPSSMKRRLEAIPMLDYDFCSLVAASGQPPDEEPPKE